MEELTDVVPSAGPFALYRLDKSGWTTPDAVAAVRRRWRVDLHCVSYGGLKDRHAITSQFLTIEQGPRRGLQHHSVRLTYLGQVDAPFRSGDIKANRFRIIVRDLGESHAKIALHTAGDVSEAGVPNYFDDQRFGSAAGGEFIGRLMVLGRYEDAVRLALTGAYEFDSAAQKREKAVLRRLWGRWTECRAALDRGHARSLVEYLTGHPDDFRGAAERLRPELQGLYLSAYQSFVWNRMLAAGLVATVPADALGAIALKVGRFPVPVGKPALSSLHDSTLPLPSARLHAEPNAVWRPWLDAALADQGFALAQMKLPRLRRPFFSKGERPAFVRPGGFAVRAGPDDRHPGRSRLDLNFDLPRGSYATLVVKRLTSTGLAAGATAIV